MKAHPIIDYPYRWLPVLMLALVLAIIQATLSWGYAGADWLPAIIDGITTIGWLAALTYLAWFVVGYVSMLQTKLITIVAGILLWVAGSFMICDIMVRIAGIPYISFASTLPFRLLFGIPMWIAVILWYHLLVVKDSMIQKEEFIIPQEPVAEPEQQEEIIDRITVKDGSRIHIIKVDELLYIQACGDYTTLVTPSGEYIKEQTMKYLEAHLPADNFVRIHRSTIVNVTQISRVELFGKETYQVSLKNGVKLRVSLTGYRLLKERLGI
ncbi:LytTR family transcriptional regulator DNA-binding domain-containing protein [uncultured Bacteroides sp.]|uniref:LytTR family transcriptional regulator DNA-binding domain-containing protein n=1 Tax=uncultured Bacteroides sp. TaxID=162156 RepID=UPI0025F010F7|nr:LytTR family transcriptional regulator DNA-binding domain-containing protein [uncultured Bacteroides sp.]